MTTHRTGHDWQTVSRHRTGAGLIAYQRCACGRWRIRHRTTAGVEQTLIITGQDHDRPRPGGQRTTRRNLR